MKSNLFRAALYVTVLHCVVWIVLPPLIETGLHTDTLEIIGWSRELAFGYPKHPPLAEWILHLLSLSVPVTVLSMSVLSQLFIVISAIFIWKTARQIATEAHAFVALVLFLESASATFWTSAFNHNLAMLPFAAAALYFSLAYFERPDVIKAGLAALAFALGFLAKYETAIVLLVVIAVSLTPRYRIVWTYTSTYFAMALGLALVLPHLVWDGAHHWQTLQYAEEFRPIRSFANGGESLLEVINGVFATSIGSVIALIICVPVRDLRNRFRFDAVKVILISGPVVALIGLSLVTFQVVRQGWFLPILFVSMIGVASALDFGQTERNPARPAALAMLIALTLAQAIGFHTLLVGKAYARHPDKYFTFDTDGFDRDIRRFWQSQTDEPLRCIGLADYRNRFLNLVMVEPESVHFTILDVATGQPRDPECDPAHMLVLLETDDPRRQIFTAEHNAEQQIGIGARFDPQPAYVAAVLLRQK